MNQFQQLLRWAWSLLVVCVLAFAMGGCEGDDGADGSQGPQGPTGETGETGPPGPPGESASVTPLESCAVCHSDGSFASAPAAHALDPIESVSDVTIAANGDDLLVTFALARDGMLTAGYDTIQRGYRTDGITRTTIVDTLSALTDNGDGSYSFTIPDGNLVAGDNRYLFRVAAGEDRETRVYFYQDYPASPFDAPPAVSAEACEACHGPEGIGVHGGYFQAEDGAEPCLTCHGRDNGTGRIYPTLVTVAHGYHNNVWDPDEHITYPTYMTNCSVCHREESQLAVVNSMPVSGANCFTCHGSMDSWDFEALNLGFHLTIPDPETANCAVCHDTPANGGVAPATVAEFHNGLETERGGIIFGGLDTSVVEGQMFAWEITGIVDDGTNLAISWQASYDGVGVDPCNETVAEGAPVFFAGDGSVRIYRSYAQGDDFIIGLSTSAPGQPERVDVTVDNTTCEGGVATTTIPVDDVDADKGRLVFGGKPLVLSSLLDPATVIEARVPSPTYDWLLGDGEMVARRAVVDTEQCLGCHVGSLYQHGGDRVDNVDICLVCHNAASNEKSVRVGMGVDESEAYDGQAGQTFELKTMLHRIHSSGKEGQPPFLIYRNRGIYAFAPHDAVIPNWPGTGQQVVFGSDPEFTTNHNFHSPTYPRALNECTACHVEDFMVIPDQTESMASTVDAGSDEWANQLDDVLQGAATSACVTCHADSASKGHAFQNSWVPQEFPEGRETIIEAGN